MQELDNLLVARDIHILLLAQGFVTWSRMPALNSRGPRAIRSSIWPWGYPWLDTSQSVKCEADNAELIKMFTGLSRFCDSPRRSHQLGCMQKRRISERQARYIQLHAGNCAAYTESRKSMAFSAAPFSSAASDTTELNLQDYFTQTSFLHSLRIEAGRGWTRTANTQGLWRNSASAGGARNSKEARNNVRSTRSKASSRHN